MIESILHTNAAVRSVYNVNGIFVAISSPAQFVFNNKIVWAWTAGQAKLDLSHRLENRFHEYS